VRDFFGFLWIIEILELVKKKYKLLVYMYKVYTSILSRFDTTCAWMFLGLFMNSPLGLENFKFFAYSIGEVANSMPIGGIRLCFRLFFNSPYKCFVIIRTKNETKVSFEVSFHFKILFLVNSTLIEWYQLTMKQT